ncbi:MAG: hypothetical protein V4706_05445 [Pseudomonadota bacterium]
MTLAIAWRSEGRIHLASDTRITLGDNQYSDVGIKVIAVPVIVTDTGGLGPGISEIFRQSYGFAYAGSFVNAGTFCEVIGELLQHVQYVQEKGTLSFLTICDFLVEYSSYISTEICAYLTRHGRYEFFFTGFCPKEQRLRAARFRFEHADGHAQATYDEIIRSEGEYVAIGSGASNAEARIKEDRDYRSMLLVLNEVIDSKEVPSVGGDLQYGSFGKDRNFGISGISRITLETVIHNGQTYGPQEQRIFRYRGFGLYENWDPAEKPLWVTPSIVELHVPSNELSVAHFRRQRGIPST